MMGILLSFIGILVTYFGIDHKNVNEKVKDPKKAKRIKIFLLTMFIALFIVSVISAINDSHESAKTISTIKDDSHKIDSLSTNSKLLITKNDSLQRTANHIDSLLGKVYGLSVKNKNGAIEIIRETSFPLSVEPCPINVETSSTPGKAIQTLCNGDKILIQYAVNKDGTLTIPYLKGKDFAGYFSLNHNVGFDVNYIKATGTFDLSKHGGFSNGSKITFSANIPVKTNNNSEPISKIITVKGINTPNGMSATLKDDFFSNDVTQIGYGGQAYSLKADYSQNKSAKTITWTNGMLFRNDDIIRASR